MLDVKLLVRRAEELGSDTETLLDTIKDLSGTFDKQGRQLLEKVEAAITFSRTMNAEDLDRLEHYIEGSYAIVENIRILFEALENNFRWMEEIRKKITEMPKKSKPKLL